MPLSTMELAFLTLGNGLGHHIPFKYTSTPRISPLLRSLGLLWFARYASPASSPFENCQNELAQHLPSIIPPCGIHLIGQYNLFNINLVAIWGSIFGAQSRLR